MPGACHDCGAKTPREDWIVVMRERGTRAACTSGRMELEPESAVEPNLVVTRDQDMWIIRVELNGKVQEYRCVSEVQARTLAVLLTSPPEPSRNSH